MAFEMTVPACWTLKGQPLSFSHSFPNSTRKRCPPLFIVRGKRSHVRISALSASSGGRRDVPNFKGGFIIQPGSTSMPTTGSSSANSNLYLPFLRPAETDAGAELGSLESQLEVLREGRGLWHEQAPVIASLLRAGLTPSTILDATGMSGNEQNFITVGAQVMASLRSAGMDEQSLSHFDIGGAEVLYELRILSASQRRDAAEYVAANALDAKGAREVARAIKEHERRRRDEGWESFSSSPSDCMAFAMYRQSIETRGEASKIECLESALEYAATSKASQKITRVLNKLKGIDDSAGDVQETESITEAELIHAAATRLQTIRLRSDETQAIPLPVLGEWESLTPFKLTELLRSEVLSSAQTEGPFRLFSFPALSSDASHNFKWVALPGWDLLVSFGGEGERGEGEKKRRLGCIVVGDPLSVPVLKFKAGGKQQSQGVLLVVDFFFFSAAASAAAATEGKAAVGIVSDYVYLTVNGEEAAAADSASAQLSILPGSAVLAARTDGKQQQQQVILGRVLLCLVPPDLKREAREAAANDEEEMSWDG